MSIHHVALEIRREEVDAEAGFWALLGFHRVKPPETLRDRAVWVQREGRQVHLMYADDPVAPPYGHTAMVAEDYDAVVERLRGGGSRHRRASPPLGDAALLGPRPAAATASR